MVSETPSQRTILVVDDNHDIANLTAKLLRLLGQRVFVAYNGENALRLYERYTPDLVLLDIAMPEMDGCEVAKQLRERAAYSDELTIVAVTGYSQSMYVEQITAAGFDCHLVKPVGSEVYKKLIAGEFIPLRR